MSEFMHHLPQQELEKIISQADGKYSEARLLALQEVQRRAAVIALIGTVDMPVADPEEYLEKPPVHNHGPSEGRGLDCGERVVEGNLRGWCMDEYIVPTDPADLTICEGCS